MKLMSELLTTDVGLMSVAGMVFMIGMGVYMARYFVKHMRAEEAAAARSGKR
jgi:uncharacterized membrane protein YqhA